MYIIYVTHTLFFSLSLSCREQLCEHCETPTGVHNLQENAPNYDPSVSLCLGSLGFPRRVDVFLWARYPCTTPESWRVAISQFFRQGSSFQKASASFEALEK